jgi:hypothetical protein
MPLECLDYIIGLSRSECPCITDKIDNVPVDWFKKSTSGLFLDELPGIVGIKSVEASQQCAEELTTFYKQAIETSKTTLRDDFIIGLTQRFRQAQKTYIGKGGGQEFTANEVLAGVNYAGVHLRNDWMRGGSIKLKSIYCMFAAPPLELKVYRMACQTFVLEELQTITPIPAITANTVHQVQLASPIELSMDGYEYFVLYNAAGVVPKNNSVSCGCGAIERLLLQYLRLEGVVGSDLSAFNSWQIASSAHGLAFDLEVGCDASNILCELFASDMAYQAVIANSIRFKAAELVMEKVLASENINRYTMLDREYLWGKRNNFRKEYLDRVTWMVETVDISSFTDCYVCNTNQKLINKSGLLI